MAKPEQNNKTDDELLEEMIAAEEGETFADELDDHIAESMKDPEYAAAEVPPLTEDPTEESSSRKQPAKPQPALNEPQIPTPEEEPNVPNAPAAVEATAVETTPSGKKFGWQQAPVRDARPAEPCSHMGIVQARKQIANQDIGHEWVCTCGTEFVVSLNSSGKKILKESNNG